MSKDQVKKVRLSSVERSQEAANDLETDALWAKFNESVHRAQKGNNHPVETLHAVAESLAALGAGMRRMLQTLIDKER